MFLRAGLSLPPVFGARLRRALLAATLAALCCAAASAQSGVEETGTGGNHTIQGRIVFPSGRRADVRLKVRLQSSQSGELSVFTDNNGSFAFRSLGAGTYTVVIEGGEDFQTVTESVYIEPEVITMITGMPTPPISRPYTLQVYLQPKRRAGDPEKAGVVDAALAGVPKPAQDLYAKALDAERRGDNQKAAALLADAVTQYPQFGLAHNELGMIELRSNELDKAVEEFKAAQKTMPDDPQVGFNYGVALLEKKDYAGAEKQLRRAQHGMEQNAQLHYFLGIVMIGGKQIEEAESQFRQSVKLGGDPAGRAHYYLGGIYWSKRDYKKAADELELYLKASPKAPDAEQVRGTIKELRAKK